MTAFPIMCDDAPQLGDYAARLIDIAGCVAAEAENATRVVRGLSAHAARIASLAAGLETAAGLMETGVRQQAEALALARTALSTNKPIISALEDSAAGVAAICSTIATIAQESRMLSLNARIEAAHTDGGSKAFGVVAAEMSALAVRTKSATDEIGVRSALIAKDVGVANDIVAAHEALATEQDDLLAASLLHATNQRSTAVELAAITAETVDTVDRAAMAIGRVGANAVAVKVLARQLARAGRADA